jgi:hypothetical protein
MITVLGELAEFDRELIRSRPTEGRERAKASGAANCRKPKRTHHQRSLALARRNTGKAMVDIARDATCSARSTANSAGAIEPVNRAPSQRIPQVIYQPTGAHTKASRCPSEICPDVIFEATASRSLR